MNGSRVSGAIVPVLLVVFFKCISLSQPPITTRPESVFLLISAQHEHMTPSLPSAVWNQTASQGRGRPRGSFSPKKAIFYGKQ